MTSEELALMDQLCRRIAVEKDPVIFDRLVRELNDLLDKKQQRIHSDREPEPSK